MTLIRGSSLCGAHYSQINWMEDLAYKNCFGLYHFLREQILTYKSTATMAGGRRNKMQKLVAGRVQHDNVSSRSDDPNTAFDLPTELLQMIFSLLNLRDNIRASAVCKHWLAVATSIREPNKAPWLISFPKSGDWYQFYDPSSRRMYYAEYPELSSSKIFYFKDGWLLAFKPRTRRVFFFHPYTRELIKLPKMQSALDNLAFSAAPTSSNCVIFTLKNVTPTVLAVCTCSPGAPGWNTMIFHNTLPFVTSIWNKVVVSKGLFYCLSLNGLLGLFNPETSMWCNCPVPPPTCMANSSMDQWRRGRFMVEYEGVVLVIYTHGRGNPIIYKLDEAQDIWREVRSLGGVTLFANSLSSIGASGFHGTMRSRVIFSKLIFHGNQCVSYSPDTGRYYPRKCLYDWGKEDAFQSVWIHPPLPQQISTFQS